MVTRHYEAQEEELPFRRYNGRYVYPLSHDREIPHGPNHGPYGGHRHHQLPPHDGRQGSSGQSPEHDSNGSNPRRRIPVACGRCRKRKIRCSGDPGNGGPCTNCKSAGNDTCQFLRVSSTEAHIKNENADFDSPPASASSRVHCRMAPSGPQFYPQTIALGPDGFPYRHQSLSAFPYPLKAHSAYYGIPSFPEFADDTVDFLQGASYPLMSPDSVAIPNYAMSNAGRGWNSSPQIPKHSSALFVDQDSSYSHAQYGPSTTYPIRSMISTESKAMSLNGMASALPTPTPDRVLPYPATGRQPIPYLRSSEGHGVLQSSQSARNLDGMHSYNNGLMTNGMVNAVKAINNGAMSENGPMHYLPLASNNPEPIPSTQLHSTQIQYSSSSPTPVELYTTVDDRELYRQPRHHSSSGSIYQPSPSDGRRGSNSDHPSPSSQTNLSNGYAYIPHLSPNCPQPPMEEMRVPLPQQPQPLRSSSTAGIQAS